MSNISSQGFCSDQFWSSSLSWDTDNPDLSLCFQQTVLVCVPALVLLIGSPFTIHHGLKNGDRHVPVSLIHMIKALLNLLLCVLASMDLVHEIVHSELALVHVVASVMRVGIYSWALILMAFVRHKAMVTSATLLAFWGLNTVCTAITFRSILVFPDRWIEGGNWVMWSLVAHFPLALGICFFNFFAEPKPLYIDPRNHVDNLSPETYAPIPSTFLFSWLDQLMYLGYKRQLKPSDLFGLSFERRCKGIVPRWYNHWDRLLKQKESGKKLSILSTVVKTFGVEYGIASIWALLNSLIIFVNPQLVDIIISFAGSNEPLWHGMVYVVLILVVALTTTFTEVKMNFLFYTVGMKVRTGLTAAIYRKSVLLSNTGRKLMTLGETTNLMTIDTQRFMDLALYLDMIYLAPLQVCLSIIFLWNILGAASLAGVAVMALLIPLNSVVAKFMRKYQFQQMKEKDNRCKLMDEVLNGMKLLKLYGWEPSFEKKILTHRKLEIKALTKCAYIYSFITLVFTCATFVVTLASFGAFILLNPETGLSANTVFVSFTLFNLLQGPLGSLPFLVSSLVQCEVSLRRINDFMNADELGNDWVTHENTYSEVIHVDNADFAWETHGPAVLHNIDFKAKRGDLVAIVGEVGCGKSSLLSALLGEMERKKGTNNVKGNVAYVAQQAWLQNATIKDNICFGKNYSEKLFKKVVEACALERDLDILPGGDQTEIGEKGINLSGGQKQRINLARAVYSNRSTYFLDDPLSAVDAHVGKHIFKNVIGPKGLLARKTRVLVTHSISYLPQMDHIYVMCNGQITEHGTYTQLLSQKGDFSNFLLEHLAEERAHGAATDEEAQSEMDVIQSDLESSLGPEVFARRFSKQLSMAQPALSDVASSRHTLKTEERTEGNSTKSELTKQMIRDEVALRPEAKLIEVETSQEGSVKRVIYWEYAKCVGVVCAALTILFNLVYQVFLVGSSILLSVWTDDPYVQTHPESQTGYLISYGLLGLGQGLFVMLSNITIMIGTLKAARHLHHHMLKSIMHSPMSFFDTTPVGRILNRFSKDMDMADVIIPNNLRNFFSQVLSVLGTIITMIYVSPYFILVMMPMAVIFVFLQKYYISTARQVKRMENVSRSPIYTHFGETVSGCATIRAYNMVERFIDVNDEHIDYNQRTYYPNISSNRWLAVRLELLGNLLVVASAIIAVFSRDSLSPGKVGLSLSYALNIAYPLQMLIRQISEIETNMVSVERIIEYHTTPQEGPYWLPESDPPFEWPSKGVLEFQNYETRYREGLDLVLRGINLHIKSGEKVGVVGRTGAGKSSLTLALFRLIESTGGCIKIDGENIGQMGLGRLRSSLTIIPQDPVLFAGTIRSNLDPFQKIDDAAIWRALEQAHLKSYVANLKGTLNFEVNEGGSNLSTGQRQLVCLARALLRKSKVLILDEATAAVDLETDDLIQDTIRREFSECTILTIAHRLNTILDYSKVLVLDAGKVVEFAPPELLLKDTKSIFYGMVKEAGLLHNTGASKSTKNTNIQ